MTSAHARAASVTSGGGERRGRRRVQFLAPDYLGQTAAEAAQAIRRAGLRPALERSFGWEPGLYGQVVAQEPAAGSELARDSAMLLFVAAPGDTPAEGSGEVRDAQPRTEPFPCVDQPPVAPHGGVNGVEQRQRRRRKGHRAVSRPVFEDPPPPPVPRAQDRAAGAPQARVHADTAVFASEHEAPDYVDREDGEFEDGWERQLVARAGHVFATGTGRTARRSGYPRRPRASFGTPGADRHPPRIEEVERMTTSTFTTMSIGSAVRPWIRLAGCGIAGLLLGVALAALLPGAHVHALNAAGAFNGTPISGVQTFVDKLKGNLVWLGGTAMGLVIAVVGIMFMAGHSRAHDLAIRTIAGLAILASISGIVA
jgi:hypothetical protein